MYCEFKISTVIEKIRSFDTQSECHLHNYVYLSVVKNYNDSEVIQFTVFLN